MGNSSPMVLTTYFPSLVCIKIGVSNYKENYRRNISTRHLSQAHISFSLNPRRKKMDLQMYHALTSKNSLKNCLHMPHGLQCSSRKSVATPTALMSPLP